MAPSIPTPAHTAAHAQTSKTNNIELMQPGAKQTMQPAASTPEQQKEQQQQELSMRGGEMCPGRFCFIIPCPLPCNCCII